MYQLIRKGHRSKDLLENKGRAVTDSSFKSTSQRYD